MESSPQVIAIAGPSCSGKSCIADGLVDQLGAAQCRCISLDHYYHDLRHLSPEQRAQRDFDCPEALDGDLIARHVAQLKQGLPVDIPQYDFATHLRTDATAHLTPARYIIIEGLFALCYPDLLPLIDLGIYTDLDDDVALARRIQRDVRERGRTRESVVTQFRTTVQPAVARYIRPSAAHASLSFDGTVKLADSIARIMKQLESPPDSVPHH